jgi:hypothetical protein
MLAACLLAAALAAGDPAQAEALRRELAQVADRLEKLKAAGVRSGREIESLLSTHEALASQLDALAARPPRPSRAADPRELRERADRLRDESDRLRAILARVDDQLRDETRRRRRAERLGMLEQDSALFGDPSSSRIAAPGTGGSSPPPGPPGPPPPGPVGGTGNPTPGSPPGAAGGQPPPTTPTPTPTDQLGMQIGASPATRLWEGLSVAPGNGLRELQEKRREVARELENTQARILELEREAREVETQP